MASNSKYGGCSFSEAKAKAKANAQGSDIGANAIRGGTEGNCNRKGAIATCVGLEARSKRRMLRFEEAYATGVGTEVNARLGTEVNCHATELDIAIEHVRQ